MVPIGHDEIFLQSCQQGRAIQDNWDNRSFFHVIQDNWDNQSFFCGCLRYSYKLGSWCWFSWCSEKHKNMVVQVIIGLMSSINIWKLLITSNILFVLEVWLNWSIRFGFQIQNSLANKKNIIPNHLESIYILELLFAYLPVDLTDNLAGVGDYSWSSSGIMVFLMHLPWTTVI